MTNMQFNDPDATIDPQAEDTDTPFSLPDSARDDNGREDQVDNADENLKLDPTHPATDSATNIDPHEEYDAGLAAAAEASEPRDDAVTGYDPDNDERQPTAKDKEIEDTSL
jgi:hypothetical protein